MFRIRIRIYFGRLDPDPDPAEQNQNKLSNFFLCSSFFDIFSWTYIIFDTIKSEKSEKIEEKNLKQVFKFFSPVKGVKKTLDPEPDPDPH